MSTQTQSDSQGSRTRRAMPLQWTEEAEELLLSTLVVQANIGKRSDTGYKPEAWEACICQLKLDLDFVCTRDQAKGKNNTLKAHFKSWCELGKQSGFGWDEDIQRYVADEDVWRDYLRVGSQ
jgi:hypothetical protein